MNHGINYIDETYINYPLLLKHLVSINTVYSNTEGIKKALRFCKIHFEKYLSGFKIYFDSQNNLIGLSKNIYGSKPLVYLSAHIDTVPANGQEWDNRFDPFKPYEDQHSIVGRGASDDKAGVAYELFLAQLISRYFPKTTNIVFTISSREEQSGISAQAIGRQLGKKLPLGPKAYLITLENNVQITHPPTLCINYGEHGAIGIEVEGKLKEVKTFLKKDKNRWNPTITIPITNKPLQWDTLEQTGGHAATVKRENNLLYTLLYKDNSNHLALLAGNPNAVSNVPKIVQRARVDKPINHKLTFDLRTMKSIPDLKKELDRHHISYRFVKQLDNGYNCKEKLFNDEIYSVMNRIKPEHLNLRFEINPGSTDSGKIYHSCSDAVRKKLIPITMGPGSRSQRDTVPPRMTHGINETYMKKPGLAAIQFITALLSTMQFLQ